MLWRWIRFLAPRRFRFFYEGHPSFPGQLWYEERKLVYQTVCAQRPRFCYEIGTWRGGGSTYFTACALASNGVGVLHTVEIDEALYTEAVANYHRIAPELSRYVNLHCGDYREIYGPILKASPEVDMLFLDGLENADLNEQEFLFFLPYMKKGALIFQHDWNTEKARQVREYLEQSSEWKIIKVLSPPYSPGFALSVKI